MSSELAPRHDAPSHDDPPPVYKSNLEEFEREGNPRLPFLLTYREVKLLGIAGVRPSIYPVTRPLLIPRPSFLQVGFFLDGTQNIFLCALASI